MIEPMGKDSELIVVAVVVAQWKSDLEASSCLIA